MKGKIIVSLCLACLSPALLAEDIGAREIKSDTELWQAVTIDFKPVKRLKLYIEGQLRYYKSITALKSNLSEIGIGYRVNKWLGLRMNYRLTTRATTIRHRFDANAQIYLRWQMFKVSGRVRLQEEFVKDAEPRLCLRSRLKVVLGRNWQVRPFIAGEIFHLLAPDPGERREYRLTFGTEWRLKKRAAVTLFYHRQQVSGEEQSERTHIIGLKFNYSL